MRAKTAVILAAGRGSRLGDITDDKPKCLVELAGKSLLAWQIEALRSAGIEHIYVVRGYLKERLSGPGYHVLDNPRWHETNMVESLRCASSILEQDATIVSYADIVYRTAYVSRLAALEEDIAITYDTLWLELWNERFADPLADAETFRARKGRLEAIGEHTTSLDSIEGQYMGLLRFTPQGWSTVVRLLEELAQITTDTLDMTALLQRLLSRGTKISTSPVEGGWCEVDNIEDLQIYESKISKLQMTEPWRHDWRL